MMNRRDFVRYAGLGALLPMVSPSAALARAVRWSANERVTLGFVGTGNMGMNLLRSFLPDERVQVVALCDVNRGSDGYWNGGVAGLEPARALVEEAYGKEKRTGTYRGVDTYHDFREVIAREDIDALVLALPDHWHAIPVILGAQAGKHMYGEKPLSLTVAEGRAMSEAVNRARVVFQTGSQQRSLEPCRRAAEVAISGRLGKLHTVRCVLPGGTPDFGKTGHRQAPEPVPAGFDYEMWLGPAPERPYIPARSHVNWRWFFDYSGGQVTDWGAHHIDIAQWGMGTDRTGPTEIRNVKATFATEPAWNTATAYHFEAVYPSGVRMIVTNEGRNGVTFEGEDGWIWMSRRENEASSPDLLQEPLGRGEIRLYESEDHHRNFIDCVLAGREPVAPIEVAHRSITIAHLANIAMRLGRESLRWDPATERILGDREASAMLSRPMRAPWRLPVVS